MRSFYITVNKVFPEGFYSALSWLNSYEFLTDTFEQAYLDVSKVNFIVSVTSYTYWWWSWPSKRPGIQTRRWFVSILSSHCTSETHSSVKNSWTVNKQTTTKTLINRPMFVVKFDLPAGECQWPLLSIDSRPDWSRTDFSPSILAILPSWRGQRLCPEL